MKSSLEGLVFLASLEGVALSKYLCSAGVVTIGVGATKSEIPDIAEWPASKTITVEDAFDLLDKSIVRYENAINKALKVEVTQNQFDALVSIAYNIGTHGAATSTFMRRINTGASMSAITAAILMWDKPKEIIGRRKKEVELFSKGNYGDGKVSVFAVNSKLQPVYSKGKIIDARKYLA